MTSIFFYDTQIGKIGIGQQNDKIIAIVFDGEKYDSSWEEKDTPFKKKVLKQMEEYLEGKRKTFDIDIYINTTEFSNKVLKEISKIAYGKTTSYRDIAISIGNPKASRAVGTVCNRNPLPLIIPCHRVIATNGSLVGYRGGIDVKKQLLDLEMRMRRKLER
jgi:methylated-DNA-[protein]-cysteine S-methyltransferase